MARWPVVFSIDIEFDRIRQVTRTWQLLNRNLAEYRVILAHFRSRGTRASARVGRLGPRYEIATARSVGGMNRARLSVLVGPARCVSMVGDHYGFAISLIDEEFACLVSYRWTNTV
jgi:hypothetical protein